MWARRAYSSMMITSADMAGDGSQARRAVAASSSARALQDGHCVAEQRGGLLWGGGQASDARGPRLELHALPQVEGPHR
jgi:hypothetical protein